jgi:hypothetical protein
VVYAIGDALANEMGQLLVQVGIVQQHGAAGADRERVFIAWGGSAGIGCCDGWFCVLVAHLFPLSLPLAERGRAFIPFASLTPQRNYGFFQCARKVLSTMREKTAGS